MENCWLDPQGKIHEVPFSGHNEFARKMIEDEMGFEEASEFLEEQNMYAYEWLHSKGWIRVQLHCYTPKIQILGGCMDLTKAQRNTMDPPMNNRQMKVAKLLCEEIGEDFHKAINDKRWW